jgi:hypothetical protein
VCVHLTRSKHVWVHTYVHAYICTHKQTHTRHVCVHLTRSKHVWVHTYVHTYVHTNKHTRFMCASTFCCTKHFTIRSTGTHAKWNLHPLKPRAYSYVRRAPRSLFLQKQKRTPICSPRTCDMTDSPLLPFTVTNNRCVQALVHHDA